MPGMVSAVVESVLERVHQLEVTGYGDDEVTFIAETVQEVSPSHIFEWGTNRGSSARIFWEAVQFADLACEVHTTELPDELAYLDRDHPGRHRGLFIQNVPVKTHLGDGLVVSLQLCKEFKSARPLFFLDGDHSYSAVSRELYAIAANVPEAIILMHDTGHLATCHDALYAFLNFHGSRYDLLELESQAGMARLWPVAV